ncbi:MAG: MarR family winged helix-turn-helix transcriptional regulator [Planctomycetota bacterium]
MASPVTIADPPQVHRLAPTLRRCWFQLNQVFRRRISEHTCTPDQFTVLRWLVEHPTDVTQRILAELMASDENTIASLVSRMEGAKLIARTNHELDGRCNVLVATTQGQEVYKRVKPIAMALQNQLMASIPADERAAFLVNLGRIADAGREMALVERAAQRARRH